MVVILSIVLATLISLILTLRSMRNFEEEPKLSRHYTLYLIKNERGLNKEALYKLYQYASSSRTILSLERLRKGSQSVLVIFAPSDLPQHFPHLHLLELEDYLQENITSYGYFHKKNNVLIDHSLGWMLTKNKQTLKIDPNFLEELDLKDNQRLFWQIVCLPLGGKRQQNNIYTHFSFQVTMRILIVDPDTQSRIDLAKKVDQLIRKDAHLARESRERTTKSLFESFKKRTLIPVQVREFILNDDQLLSLIRA